MLYSFRSSGFSKDFVKAFRNGFPRNWLSHVAKHFESESGSVAPICLFYGIVNTNNHLALAAVIWGDASHLSN